MELLLFSLIVGFASWLQAITGFGLALIVVPLSLLILDQTTIVTALVFVSIFLNGYLIKQIKQPADTKILIPLVIASAFGIPIGIWILNVLPVDIMKIVAGSLAIVFSITIYKSHITLPKSKLFTVFIGWISGILQTSIAMSGPPVALLLSTYYEKKDAFRKNLVLFFFYMNVIATVILFISNNDTQKGFLYGIYVLPAIALGAYTGNRMVKHIPQKQFRILAFSLVGLTGFYSIISVF